MVTNIKKELVASIYRIEVCLEIYVVYVGGWAKMRKKERIGR
jgi:hypothetical protein